MPQDHLSLLAGAVRRLRPIQDECSEEAANPALKPARPLPTHNG